MYTLARIPAVPTGCPISNRPQSFMLLLMHPHLLHHHQQHYHKRLQHQQTAAAHQTICSTLHPATLTPCGNSTP